jgi:pimeloyl-ACP methyl ester carboxylesterase
MRDEVISERSGTGEREEAGRKPAPRIGWNMVTTQERNVTAWRRQVDTRVRVAGDGPPLVFLHGAYGLQWDPFLDALSQSFTVYAPEHPGTTPGAPDAIKPIDTLWDLVLYYYELFDGLGLRSPAIVGHSFGGMVAAELAATNPERCSKLVLIDAIGLWREDQPVRNWMMTAQTELPKLLFADQEAPMAKMMSAGAQMMRSAPNDAMLDMQIQMMWSLACTGKFVWPIPDKGLHKRLHRISAPTLVVWGKQDGIAAPLYADEFTSRIPNARAEVIDGAAHAPQTEQMETVVRLVREFLS